MLNLLKTTLCFSFIVAIITLNGCASGAPNYGERDAEEELTAEHR